MTRFTRLGILVALGFLLATGPTRAGLAAGYGSTPAPPGPIGFAPVVVGSASAAIFTVQETGSSALTISNPLLGGTNPGDFFVATSFPLTIADGAPAQNVVLGCAPQFAGARDATLTLTTNDPLLPTVSYSLECTGLPPPGLDYYTLTPCRQVDTRVGGVPLMAGGDRTFTIAGGICGVPDTAKAVSLNIAVTGPTASGNVRLFPQGSAPPATSTINYSMGQTRTNNVVVGLGGGGGITTRCAPTGSTHLILDVNGYFE